MSGGAGGGGREVFLVANSVDRPGGVTGWTHRMAGLFAARGHRVRVIGVVPGDDGSGHPHRPVGRWPYPVHTLHRRHPLPPGGGRGRWPLRRVDPVRQGRRLVRAAMQRRGAAWLSALLADAGPGAVLIVAQVWAMEWVARAATDHLTVIGMSHESYEASRASSRHRRVLRHYRDVDRLVVLTREDADRWAADGLTQVDWLPNPLPLDPDTTPPSPRTAPVVAYLGRLSDEKGVDLLLAAWAQVSPRHPHWRLHLHGTGDPAQERALRARSHTLGVADTVRWLGWTDDVAGALRGASVLALPSRAEGFPLALLEAMALGVPCAAFDCAPGVREIVRDGVDGLLAPPGDVDALARRLETLLADAALRHRLGEAARRGVVERYGPERIVRCWEELFAFLER